MSNYLQAVRGMNDILPNTSHQWRFVEATLINVLENHGYAEIRTPLIEKTELFERSIGEVTDIVEKEMYTFTDRNGDRLTLRPEGTAGCVRAVIENGLLRNAALRLWYLGAMFRHERPQKGRYRQFHQIGVETFGFSGPDIDVELILMSARMLRAVGLMELRLEINSLGTPKSREFYRNDLINYLSKYQDQLDADSQRRLTTNPLRILDSKDSKTQNILADAPQLINYLDDQSRMHFEKLCTALDAVNLPYIINPRLVRGLDYYTHTVFEWVTTELGAQGTVCAGGRFDNLVAQLGGTPTPAAGFALGLERLVVLLSARGNNITQMPFSIYLIHIGDGATNAALILAENLRNQLPKTRIIIHCGGGGLKAQLRQADKSAARLALIIGEDELNAQMVTIKDLRSEFPQQTIAQINLNEFLLKNFNSII